MIAISNTRRSSRGKRHSGVQGSIVLLNVTETLEIAAPIEEVWTLLCDTPRLAAMVPGVEEALPIEGSEREAYRVRVSEKVGPFKVVMKLELSVTERTEPCMVAADVKGGDAFGMGRATGSIKVALQPAECGTSMSLLVNVEILGKLAALGAPVVRRRVTELFGEFGRRVIGGFAAVPA
jgi:carbon monoxide dehydrogenase subunit G